MKWFKSYLLLMIALSISLVWADSTVITENLQSTPLQEGTVIAYFNKEGSVVSDIKESVYYRKLLKIENSDRFMVQDFFTKTQKKQIDPIFLLSQSELLSWTPAHLDGHYVQWYENGLKQLELSFENGLLEGEGGSWFESGQQQSQVYFKQGKEDGLLKYWHENGQKAFEMQYENGFLDGTYKIWNEEGLPILSYVYKKDQLQSQCDYIEGKPVGDCL